MGIEIHASEDEALFLRAHDAYAGAPASSYTPGGCGTAREAPAAALSGAALCTVDGPPLSHANLDPPGLLLLQLTAPAAIVVVATSQRIAISPDYAEEFGKQLIAAAGAARAAKTLRETGDIHGHVRTD